MARTTFNRLNTSVAKRRAAISGYRGIVVSLSREERASLDEVFGTEDSDVRETEMPAHIAAAALRKAA